MKRSIVVRAWVEGLHHWPEAPDAVAFLRNPHRHTFYVTLTIDVRHDDRELEFILVKRALEAHLKPMERAARAGEVSTNSCEHIAGGVLAWALGAFGDRSMMCEVSEDGENGAIVYT